MSDNPDPNRILRNPGRLCINPTDLSTPYPHGGTALGNFRGAAFRPLTKPQLIAAEEFGGQTVEVIYGGDSALLACIFRDVNSVTLSALFLDTKAGSNGSRTVTGEADRKRAGTPLRTLLGVKLFFSPRAFDSWPAFILYKAVPVLEEGAEIRLSMGEEFGLTTVFHGTPNSGNRVWATGLGRDLSLV